MTWARGLNAVVAALLVGAGIWVARHTYWADVTIHGPPEGEAATNPYYSLQKLTRALGIRTDIVATLSAPRARGSALLINGMQEDLQHSRVESLAPWVQSGGRLIVTGDVLWASGPMQAWSGIAPGSHLVEKQPKPATPPTARRVRDPDADCAPLTVKINGSPTGETLTYCAPPSTFEFVSRHRPAWSLSSEYGIQMLRVNIGRGSLTIVPRRLIDNKSLLRKDHARIFLTAAQLARGDRLYLLNVFGAESLMALLWRLAAPAIVLLGLAILCIIWRNMPRFGPPAPAPAAVRRSLAEQIRANAAFAWRTGQLGALRKAARRSVEETANRCIAQHGALSEGRRIGRVAELTGLDAQSLNAAMTMDAAAGAPAQRSAISLLERTRRLLQDQNSTRTRRP